MLDWRRMGVVVLVVLSIIMTGVNTSSAGKRVSVGRLSEKVKKLEKDVKGLDQWLQIINVDHEVLSGRVKDIGQSVIEISEDIDGLDRWLKELTIAHEKLVTIVRNLNNKVNQLTRHVNRENINKGGITEKNESQ